MSSEKDKARSKEWYSQHREYARERQKAYYQAHKIQSKEQGKKWLEANRAKARASKNKYTETLRTSVLHKLGNKCRKCGFTDKRALQVDHVKGGGNKERRTTSWLQVYKKVLAEVESVEYQLLCANCNQIKKIENKENPQRIDT